MTPLAPNGYATDLYLAKVRSSEWLFQGYNGKNVLHFHKFKMKKKMYVVLLLPFFVLLVSVPDYLHNLREGYAVKFFFQIIS